MNWDRSQEVEENNEGKIGIGKQNTDLNVLTLVLTVLSRPNMMIMRKKMMAKKVAAGMLAMASA